MTVCLVNRGTQSKKKLLGGAFLQKDLFWQVLNVAKSYIVNPNNDVFLNLTAFFYGQMLMHFCGAKPYQVFVLPDIPK